MQEVIGTFYSNILTIHTCTHTLQKFIQNVLISEKKILHLHVDLN